MALDGRTALVTGSTSGIGLAIARSLAAAGCDLIIPGLGDPDKIDLLVRELIDQHHIRAVYIPADVAKPAEIRTMVARTAERFASVDILVNNAGIQHVAPIEEFPDEKWDQVLAINLSPAFHATKAVLPHMRQKG